MADAKRPRKVQRHHGRRTRRGDAVAFEHRPALIPPVAQRAGENAQRRVRRVDEQIESIAVLSADPVSR